MERKLAAYIAQPRNGKKTGCIYCPTKEWKENWLHILPNQGMERKLAAYIAQPRNGKKIGCIYCPTKEWKENWLHIYHTYSANVGSQLMFLLRNEKKISLNYPQYTHFSWLQNLWHGRELKLSITLKSKSQINSPYFVYTFCQLWMLTVPEQTI